MHSTMILSPRSVELLRSPSTSAENIHAAVANDAVSASASVSTTVQMPNGSTKTNASERVSDASSAAGGDFEGSKKAAKNRRAVTIRTPDGAAVNGVNGEEKCTRRNSNINTSKSGWIPTGANGSVATADVAPADATNNEPDATALGVNVTRVYARRYVMLAMFVLLSASNAMQWIEYSIIAHIITHYYGVDYWLVDWTSMIYMTMYMLLVFPGSWFLDRYGLRRSVLIGALGNCVGAWLKLLSTSPDKFWLTFIAQTIVGSSQVFILGIPPRLAAVWFGPRQVSTACAIGVFGNQLGIAIGFILPPWLVHMGPTAAITWDLSLLFIISAILNTFVLVCIALFFRERPPHPPSLAQARAIEESMDHEFLTSLKRLIRNRNYMILLVSYGINVGVFYAVSTLLSQMVLYYHKDAQESVGTVGLLIVVAGMVGSVVCGYVLDRFHHYKTTTLLVYLFSFVGMVLFTLTIGNTEIWVIFIIASLLGFFMTGYLPLGFEFAAELTFPIAEGTTSGFLNGSVQFFGVAMTIGMGKVIYSISIFWANVMMSAFLFVGLILTALIKADLKRQNAHRNVQYTRSEAELAAEEAE